jgi:radical SAM protein with 4Fe4S-binding SPASM domain
VGLYNYKGDVHSDMPIPTFPCDHIDRLDILANGRVTLCCMDQNGEYGWGDVTQQSLVDVYRSEVATRYRSMHRSGRRQQIEPCNRCNLFWPSLSGMSALRTARFAFEVGCYFVKNRPLGRRAPTAAVYNT